MHDLIPLNGGEEVFKDKFLHDIDGKPQFRRHKTGIQLSVGVIKQQEANPLLFGS